MREGRKGDYLIVPSSVLWYGLLGACSLRHKLVVKQLHLQLSPPPLSSGMALR